MFWNPWVLCQNFLSVGKAHQRTIGNIVNQKGSWGIGLDENLHPPHMDEGPTKEDGSLTLGT